MCYTKPAVFLNSPNELELEDYIWSIHEYIDFVTGTTRLKTSIYNSMGIPHKYIVNHHNGPTIVTGIKGNTYITPGIVYAPYIPINRIQKNESKMRRFFSKIKGIFK